MGRENFPKTSLHQRKVNSSFIHPLVEVATKHFRSNYLWRNLVSLSVPFQLTQDVNWTCMRRSEDLLDIFWASYVHSIDVLRLLGLNTMKGLHLEVITWSRFVGMKFQPVQPRQISPYDYMWKLNFVPARWDSFPPDILFKSVCNFFGFFFVTVSVYEIEIPLIFIDLKFFCLSYFDSCS